MTGLAIPPSTAEARVVWRDGDLETTTCPVRAISPEAQEALQRFGLTHELTLGFGVARYTLTRLPGPGPLEAQDARQMAELAYLRDLHNALLVTATRPRGVHQGGPDAR